MLIFNQILDKQVTTTTLSIINELTTFLQVQTRCPLESFLQRLEVGCLLPNGAAKSVDVTAKAKSHKVKITNQDKEIPYEKTYTKMSEVLHQDKNSLVLQASSVDESITAEYVQNIDLHKKESLHLLTYTDKEKHP